MAGKDGEEKVTNGVTEDQKKKFDVLANAIESDLANMSSKIVTDLTTLIGSQKGVIDVESNGFKTLKNSLLNADPQAPENVGRPVISLLSTQNNAIDKLDKLGMESIMPDQYKKLRESINETRSKLETSLSNEEGVKSLLINQLEKQASKKHPFMLNPKETEELSAKVGSVINFKESNAAVLFGEAMVLDKDIAPIMRDQMAKSFGSFNKDTGVYELDKTKLTLENIEEFGKAVSQKVTSFSNELLQAREKSKMESKAIAEAVGNISVDVFKKCEDQGIKLTNEQKKDFVKSMETNFNSLGSEYVLEKQNSLSAAITNRITNSRSITGRITGSAFTLERINGITKKVTDRELTSSVNESTKKLNDIIKSRHYGDKEFSSKVEAFVISNGLENKDISKMSNTDIAKLRLTNSKHFDEIMNKGQISNETFKKADLGVSNVSQTKVENSKVTGLSSEPISSTIASNQLNNNINKPQKDGNLTFLGSSQGYDNPSKGFLSSKAIVENEINFYHLGVKQQDVEKAYQGKLSQSESEKIPKFYRDSNGEIKDYNNAKELRDTVDQTITALESMRSEFGSKYFPPTVRSQAEKLFSEKWPIITRNFDADDKKTKLNNAIEAITNDQNKEMKTHLGNISKDVSVDPNVRSNADRILNSSNPENFRDDVATFIKELPQEKNSKDLNELKKVHQESPNVRLENFGGSTGNYAGVLNEIKDVRDSILELQKSLKKYEGPTLRYTTNLPMEGQKPTSDEMSNGLTKALFEQNKFTNLDSSSKDFKNAVTKLDKKEFSNITVEFENNGKVKSYNLSPDKLKKALLKVDVIPHTDKPYEQLTREQLKEVRVAVSKQLEGIKIDSVLKPVKSSQNKVLFKINLNAQSKPIKDTVTNAVNDPSIVFPQKAKAALQNIQALKNTGTQTNIENQQLTANSKSFQNKLEPVTPKIEQKPINLDKSSQKSPVLEKNEPSKDKRSTSYFNKLVNAVTEGITTTAGIVAVGITTLASASMRYNKNMKDVNGKSTENPIKQTEQGKNNKDELTKQTPAGQTNLNKETEKTFKKTIEELAAENKLKPTEPNKNMGAKKIGSFDPKILEAISAKSIKSTDETKGFSPSSSPPVPHKPKIMQSKNTSGRG